MNDKIGIFSQFDEDHRQTPCIRLEVGIPFEVRRIALSNLQHLTVSLLRLITSQLMIEY